MILVFNKNNGNIGVTTVEWKRNAKVIQHTMDSQRFVALYKNWATYRDSMHYIKKLVQSLIPDY